MMSEKRRLSTRNRGEPPLKKRALSPPTTPAVPTLPPPLPNSIEKTLPVKQKEGGGLPTLPEAQDQNLSVKHYQTISESGVLAASVEESRRQWLNGSVFDRFWWKASKRRDMGNRDPPPKDSMIRLGICSMIIEPHVFEVTLYTVIEPPPNKIPPVPKPPPLSAPQYNPFSHNPAYIQPSFNTPVPAPPAYHAQHHNHSSRQSLPPFREGFGSFGPQGPPPIYHPPASTHTPAHTSTLAPLLGPSNAPRVLETTQSASQDEDGESKADPVIQMLANRAANDLELKNLMRVVASGKASQKQLREFQDHIDELNAMLKSSSNPPDPLGANVRANKTPLAYEPGHPSNVPSHTAKPDASWNHPVPGSSTSFSNQTLPPIKLEPSPKSYSGPVTPPVPVAPTASKSEISGIVFDFGGSGDRFSLPRFSILEYLYGGTQVIVSFIVIRQGNLAASGDYKGNMSYYQPITLRLTTLQPQILEPLARFVAPAQEVRNYMNSYFDRLKPAESVHLAMRLPRTVDGENGEKSEMAPRSDAPLIKAVYSPPDSIMPLAA